MNVSSTTITRPCQLLGTSRQLIKWCNPPCKFTPKPLAALREHTSQSLCSPKNWLKRLCLGRLLGFFTPTTVFELGGHGKKEGELRRSDMVRGRGWIQLGAWKIRKDIKEAAGYIRLVLRGAVWIRRRDEEFPGGPVVRTLRFHCRGPGFDPWSGN